MKTFTLYRTALAEDKDARAYNPTTEPQLEGVVFSDGKVAVRWLTAHRSVVVWDSFEDFEAIHITIHPEYETRIEWS